MGPFVAWRLRRAVARNASKTGVFVVAQQPRVVFAYALRKPFKYLWTVVVEKPGLWRSKRLQAAGLDGRSFFYKHKIGPKFLPVPANERHGIRCLNDTFDDAEFTLTLAEGERWWCLSMRALGTTRVSNCARSDLSSLRHEPQWASDRASGVLDRETANI